MVKAGFDSFALATNNSTAGAISGPAPSIGGATVSSGDTRNSRSPRTLSLARLVTTIFKCGQAVSKWMTNGEAGRMCSKLSKMMRVGSGID